MLNYMLVGILPVFLIVFAGVVIARRSWVLNQRRASDVRLRRGAGDDYSGFSQHDRTQRDISLVVPDLKRGGADE